MNPEINSFSVARGREMDEVLKLTSKGYSTREAKRKIERDNKKKFRKLIKEFKKQNQ